MKTLLAIVFEASCTSLHEVLGYLVPVSTCKLLRSGCGLLVLEVIDVSTAHRILQLKVCQGNEK